MVALPTNEMNTTKGGRMISEGLLCEKDEYVRGKGTTRKTCDWPITNR